MKRVGETAKEGVEEELEPIQQRLQALKSEAAEPEPTRVEKLGRTRE